MLTEKSFNTGEVIINFAEGSNNGAPLVLLHGGMQSWQALLPILTEMEKSWHIFACDLRGHGKSGRAESYRAVDYISDTKLFIQHQIKSPTVIIGHSLGAMTALGVSAAIPELVRGVIPLEPHLEIDIPQKWIIDILTNVRDVLSLQKTTSEAFPQMGEKELQIFDEKLHRVDLLVVETFLDHPRYFEGLNLQSLLNDVRCPALLIYGEFDKGGIVRENNVDYFLSHIADGQAVQIKDAGHDTYRDQPGHVLEAITEFIKKIMVGSR